MLSNLDAPGLTPRRNADGSLRYYWRASKAAIKAGYKPTVVRLHAADGRAIDLDDPLHRDFVQVICQNLQAQMIEILAGNDKPAFDGTLRSLIEMYERNTDSPFHALSAGSKRSYGDDIKKLKSAAGAAPLAKIGASDIRRWYKAALGPSGDEHVRSAHGLMVMLRILLSFGAVEEIPHAARIREIMSAMRFATPSPRKVRPSYAQARAVFDQAVAAGVYSIAFGTALQFEAMLRVWDVTGIWAPGLSSPIMRGGNGWHGPCWRDINGGILKWSTNKKGREVEIDLSLYPMIVEAMRLVPPALPGAPLIIDERTGLPYLPYAYSKRWRKIANQAGLPKEIWCRDFRAGGVTEGEDAGANMPDLAKHAAHADPSFTARVYGRGTLEASRRVAHSRIKHRDEK